MKTILVQIAMDEGASKESMLTKADRILAGIEKEGHQPDLILFPELWATGFFHFDRYPRDAESAVGPTYALMQGWAKNLHCYIHTGSFVEKEGNNYYNTSLLLDPAGQIIGKYRKIHLFTYQSREPEILTPGDKIMVLDTEFGRVGMATCYDLRFPELFREMSRRGTELILVTSGWPITRIDHWSLMNHARAVENQAYVIACNGAGTHGGATLGGHSMIVEPMGATCLEGGEREDLLICDVDLNKVSQYRETFSALRDRRIY